MSLHYSAENCSICHQPIAPTTRMGHGLLNQPGGWSDAEADDEECLPPLAPICNGCWEDRIWPLASRLAANEHEKTKTNAGDSNAGFDMYRSH